MKLSNGFSGALRTFAYFMSSGTHYMLEGVDYLQLYGTEPSAIDRPTRSLRTSSSSMTLDR